MSSPMILAAQSHALLDWAGNRLGLKFGVMCTTLAVVDQEILAVVVYSHFSSYDCQMSIASASPRWCFRAFLSAAFDYPFVQVGLARVSFLTRPDNVRVLRLLNRLGAKQEGVVRNAYGDGDDAILYGLLKEERRF